MTVMRLGSRCRIRYWIDVGQEDDHRGRAILRSVLCVFFLWGPEWRPSPISCARSLGFPGAAKGDNRQEIMERSNFLFFSAQVRRRVTRRSRCGLQLLWCRIRRVASAPALAFHEGAVVRARGGTFGGNASGTAELLSELSVPPNVLWQWRREM